MCAVLHYNVYYLRKMYPNTVFAVLCLCRKLIYSYENLRKLLPPELLLLAQICTNSFVGWGLQSSPDPLAGSGGGDPGQGEGGREVAKGWGWDGRGKEGKEGEWEGREGDSISM